MGNDETHYENKWNKDLKYLKDLLSIVEFEIAIKYKVEEIVKEMPENLRK